MEQERSRFLVETSWLAEHINDPLVRIVDMRGYVRTVEREGGVQDAEYVGARDEYEQGHIPGAVYIDWSSDIVDPDETVKAQIAPAQRFAEVMGRSGIGDQHLVVAYDTHPASQFATRLWWALNYYGHKQVVILNGGLPKWKRENRPLESSIPVYPPAIFTPVVQPQLRATAEDVLAMLNQQDVKLVDARDVGQYTGQLVRGQGRRGRIPGAVNIPREELIDPASGTFRSNEELKHIFSAADVAPEQHVVAYCNGGVAATTVLFSLAMLGYPNLTNYDGSWNEWGTRQDLPVES
ncbi:MAG TPA: sulfurtransferase [Ktedonobacteraceae bacterium]|nr:sulfurtransferase [Ktedonobacteraceae bacterium]